MKQNPADTTTSTGTNTSTFSRSLTAPTSIDNRDKEKRKSLEFDKVNVEKEMKRFGTVGWMYVVEVLFFLESYFS